MNLELMRRIDELHQGFAYLVAVMGWFSRYVLSRDLANTLDSSFCVEVLHAALERAGPPAIFNRGQGRQFTSTNFTDCLRASDIDIGMDGRGQAMGGIFVGRL